MLFNFSIFNTMFNDVAQPWQLGFQDSAAPTYTGIVELHNTIFFYLIIICIAVFWVFGSIVFTFNAEKSPFVHKYMNHGTILETV
jgi:cytochrome c oxidase subunit 2